MKSTVQNALVRLRAHAFATSRPLSAVTADIIDHRLKFDDTGGDQSTA